MDTKVKTKEGLIKELHKLHKEYDLLNTSYSKDIIERKQTEQTLKECENNLKERIKELNGIYSLGNLAEEFNKLEDIYHAFVNNVVLESMQFPEKVFVSLEIDRKKYSNIENFKLLESRKYLSAPISIYGKQAGELIVAYTEDLPFIDFFEQNLINNYAERISKITERIKTQQTLEESEIKYRNLVDNLGEGIGIVNVNEEFLFVNSVAEKIFGVGKGELLGKNLKEFLSEEHYINILNQTKIREKEQSSSYETELTLPNSEKRNILITAVPQFDDNEMFIGIYGLKPFEIEPTFEYFKSRVHPDDLHLVEESFENSIRNKATVIAEIRIIFPDVTFKWFQTIMIPIFQGDKPVALKGINIDITDRKKVEMNLAELHQFNLQIINSLEEGIIVYDSNLRHTVFNPFMEKFSGIPASQILGKFPTEVFPFLEEVRLIKILKRALNGENIDVIDFPFRLPDSEKSGWASDKNVPLRNVNGEIIGVIGTVHDITERKKSEESLKSINERFVL